MGYLTPAALTYLAEGKLDVVRERKVTFVTKTLDRLVTEGPIYETKECFLVSTEMFTYFKSEAFCLSTLVMPHRIKFSLQFIKFMNE